MFEILVPCFEDQECWEAVEAVHVRAGQYRIVRVDPALPRLRYREGDLVVCESEAGEDGHAVLRARHLVGVTL